MKKFLNEFKTFISRGNVIDLAIGVIIGGAFSKITSSLVADILMPPIGLLIGGIQFSALKLNIGGDPSAPVTINYGNFLQNVLDFILIALAIFVMIKLVNRFYRKEKTNQPPPPPPKQEVLLEEIRDLLKKQNSGSNP
jgi:large conductance mechanosensitive channel